MSLQNAVANNARVDVVNIMTFDYFRQRHPRDGQRQP